ncbi:hypothetical protein ABFG93_04835 [Pseudalkalibacillus hwajinpoensis]
MDTNWRAFQAFKRVGDIAMTLTDKHVTLVGESVVLMSEELL